eukprot:scaffold7566_cov122-Isochrysis_galbana.AAC.3
MRRRRPRSSEQGLGVGAVPRDRPRVERVLRQRREIRPGGGARHVVGDGAAEREVGRGHRVITVQHSLRVVRVLPCDQRGGGFGPVPHLMRRYCPTICLCFLWPIALCGRPPHRQMQPTAHDALSFICPHLAVLACSRRMCKAREAHGAGYSCAHRSEARRMREARRPALRAQTL